MPSSISWRSGDDSTATNHGDCGQDRSSAGVTIWEGPCAGVPGTGSIHMNANNDDLQRLLRELKGHIEEIPCDTPESFVEYLLASAQLAALGDSSCLREWPVRARAKGIDVLAAIREVSRREISLLEAGNGHAICRAEDANCLLVLEPSTTGLLDAAGEALGCWVDAAECAIPDTGAIEILEARRATVPLQAEFRLAIVSEPLSEEELRLCAGLPRPAPQRIGSRQATAASEEEELALLDGGHPSERMIRRFQARSGELHLRDGGDDLQASTHLDHWWGVRVLLDGKAAFEAESVRLGTLTLERHPDDPGVFQGSLGSLNLANRLRLLGLDICIALRNGGRVLL